MRLSLLGLPNIQSIDDLSIHTHISKHTIYQLSVFTDKYYKVYTIPKSSGGFRTISQPNKKLKAFQAWILNNILNSLKVSENCKGFENGSSIKDNVKVHVGASSIMTIDIKDFFPSITSKHVYNIFKAIGYNKIICRIFTNLCVYENTLPQGSPCSPKLANLVTWRLDKRLQGYVGRRGVVYSRYADDLTFSCQNPKKLTQIRDIVSQILFLEGFKVNKRKTRIAGSRNCKKVTGLVLTNKSFGIGVKKYRIFRAKIHRLSLDEFDKDLSLFNFVKGYLAFLNDVDKNNYTKSIKYIKTLGKKHPTKLVSKIL